MVTGCFLSLTEDKFDIVPVCALARVSFTYLHTTIYTPHMEIPGYAPGVRSLDKQYADVSLLRVCSSASVRRCTRYNYEQRQNSLTSSGF